MKAVQASAFGDADVLRLVELPDPEPGPGQITIDVTHAAVGLIDVYLRRGKFKGVSGLPQPPFVPGLEVVGTVRALGQDVTAFRVGEPVVTLSVSGHGGYASIGLADARFAVSLDGTDVDPRLAVAALPNAVTAHLALTRVTHLNKGDAVLVHGALGGLAVAFAGMARFLGAATVVGTVRGHSLPVDLATTPHDRIVAADDFPAALDDQRFDVIVDPVGGRLRIDSLDVLASLGRLLLVGNASNEWDVTVDTNAIWTRNIAIAGFSVGPYLPAHPDHAAPAAHAALAAIAAGHLDIPYTEMDLADAERAHRQLETGPVTQRILLRANVTE